MKEQDVKLTLQETEQLCRLYLDCNLSVLEETELRYFLTQVDYHSPLIDEVRLIMKIDTYISDKSFIKSGAGGRLLFRKWTVYMSIAASVALVIGIGVYFWKPSSHDSVASQSYYIAYVDGFRLNDKEARIQIEASEKSADDFINEMSALESQQQRLIDNFLINNIPE